MSDFDRFSLTIARWLTNVYDEDNPAESSTTPGDVTVAADPASGLPAFLSLDTRDADVQWIVNQNSRKKRLATLLPSAPVD